MHIKYTPILIKQMTKSKVPFDLFPQNVLLCTKQAKIWQIQQVSEDTKFWPTNPPNTRQCILLHLDEGHLREATTQAQTMMTKKLEHSGSCLCNTLYRKSLFCALGLKLLALVFLIYHSLKINIKISIKMQNVM